MTFIIAKIYKRRKKCKGNLGHTLVFQFQNFSPLWSGHRWRRLACKKHCRIKQNTLYMEIKMIMVVYCFQSNVTKVSCIKVKWTYTTNIFYYLWERDKLLFLFRKCSLLANMNFFIFIHLISYPHFVWERGRTATLGAFELQHGQ